MNRGYIKYWRKIIEWEWFRDPNTAHLFNYLLIKASHKNIRVFGIELQRGQLIFGRIKASKDTGLSERSIRTSLNKLKSTSELAIKSTNQYSIITLLNYDIYQSQEDKNDQQNDQQNDQRPTSDRPATDHIQECKEYKNVKNIYCPEFDILWKQYPRPQGRKQAFKHFMATVNSDTDLQNIKKALNNYKISIVGKETQYIKMGSTWFNQWHDWVEYTENPAYESEIDKEVARLERIR